VEIASQCLRNGAEKIVLGTAAFEKPELISQLSSTFGSQAVVVAVDIPQSNGDSIAIDSGRTIVEIAPRDFAAMAQERGAGEIIIQSVEKDGMQVGYDLQTIKKFAEFLTVPIIASSGAGSATDFAEAFYAGASGAAAGAIFQFTELTPSRVRRDLESLGIPVRRS
jgi:cyclase